MKKKNNHTRLKNLRILEEKKVLILYEWSGDLKMYFMPVPGRILGYNLYTPHNYVWLYFFFLVFELISNTACH